VALLWLPTPATVVLQFGRIQRGNRVGVDSERQVSNALLILARDNLWLANCYFAMIPQDFSSLLRFCDGQSARSVRNRAPVTAPGGLPLFRVLQVVSSKRVGRGEWI